MSESRLDCPDVEELAGELALGIASGPDRASAVAHLARCEACRRLVDDLATTADGLLLLAPEQEPSIGFESRVLAATGASPLPAPRARRRPRAWMAAAAVAVAIAGLGGLAGGLMLGDEPTQEVRSALSISASGRATCRAFAFGDDQAWVVVSLEAPPEWTSDYTVEVTGSGEEVVRVGSFHLANGQGSLTARVESPAKELRTIRVFDSSGELRYEAPFTSS